MRTPFLGWVRVGSLAAIDQAVAAGLQFVVTILMARLVSPAEYGHFALLYALVVLAHMLHSAVVIEPLMVLKSSRADEDYTAFLRGIVGVSTVYAAGWLAVSLLLALGLAMVGRGGWALSSLTVGVGVFGLSYVWLARKAFYAVTNPRNALVVSALHFGTAVGAIAVLAWLGLAGARSVIIALALTGAAVASVPIAGGLASVMRLSGAHALTAKIFGEAYQYGRWAAAGALLNWCTGNAFYVALPIFAGLQQGGLFRATMNLYLPFHHFVLSVATLLLAPLASLARSDRDGAFRASILWKAGVLLTAGLGYGALIFVFRDPIVTLLYGDRYGEVGAQAGLGLFLPIVWALVAVVVTVLRSLEQPRLVSLAFAIAVGTVGVWLIPLGASAGASGALFSYIVLQGVTAVIAVLSLLRLERRFAKVSAG